MKRTNKLALMLICLTMNSTVFAANDAATLDRQQCSLCHGAGGKTSSELFPQLAGQPAPYLIKQMKAFRDKSRKDINAKRFMWGIASSLSDQDIQNLATYYEKQQPSSGTDIKDKAAYKRGQTIFTKGIADKAVPACMSCHGIKGEGSGLMPRLAGQHYEYLKRQLVVFKGNKRPSAVMMHQIVKDMTEKDIESVASYLSTL